MTVNHTTMTGPNSRPIDDVPRRWMANRPMRITTAIGTTHRSTAGAASCAPSTADSTEMAGVMAASP